MKLEMCSLEKRKILMLIDSFKGRLASIVKNTNSFFLNSNDRYIKLIVEAICDLTYIE